MTNKEPMPILKVQKTQDTFEPSDIDNFQTKGRTKKTVHRQTGKGKRNKAQKHILKTPPTISWPLTFPVTAKILPPDLFAKLEQEFKTISKDHHSNDFFSTMIARYGLIFDYPYLPELMQWEWRLNQLKEQSSESKIIGHADKQRPAAKDRQDILRQIYQQTENINFQGKNHYTLFSSSYPIEEIWRFHADPSMKSFKTSSDMQWLQAKRPSFYLLEKNFEGELKVEEISELVFELLNEAKDKFINFANFQKIGNFNPGLPNYVDVILFLEKNNWIALGEEFKHGHA